MSDTTAQETMGLNPFGGLGEVEDDRGTPKSQGFESPLSPNIYDSVPDYTLTQFIESHIGEDNYKALQYKANCCGVEPLTALRQLMANAFLEGTFNCQVFDKAGAPLPVKPEEKRNGNDNNPKTKDNLQLQAIVRRANYGTLSSTANSLGISNKVALQRGVSAMLDTPRVLARLQDSANAMRALEKQIL